jgi:hypothetical protein
MCSARIVWRGCAPIVLVGVLAWPPVSAWGQRSVEPHAPAAVAEPSRDGRVDADQLMADLHALSAPEMEGRLAGSPGSRRAQAYIRARFEALGLEPVGGSYAHAVPLSGSAAAARDDGVNLLGLIRGTREPDRFVLVGAHYDHLGVRNGVLYPGADDNASGVSAMLALAGWFARHRPDRSVLFIAFDAEEQGLAGAKQFVARPPIDLRQVTVLVNLDMIGRGDDHTVVVAGTHHAPALKPVVASAAAGRDLTVHFGHDDPASSAEKDWTHLSDHGPFHSAGVPFLYFGVRDHPDYHRPTDTPDRIPRRFFVEATELVLDVVRRLAGPRTAE